MIHHQLVFNRGLSDVYIARHVPGVKMLDIRGDDAEEAIQMKKLALRERMQSLVPLALNRRPR